MTTFEISPITADELAAVRLSGRDASGNPVVHLAATGGEPLRCCLRDALPGEACILFGYQPKIPGTGSPYVEIGAVFAHAEECDTPNQTAYPQDWLRRPQVLRAYDSRGWIHPATTTHDGSDPAAALDAVLAAEGVVEVHSRNIAYGCYMFTARPQTRLSPAPPT